MQLSKNLLNAESSVRKLKNCWRESSIVEIFLALSGLVASFYFAGAEAAYTAFNKIRLDIWQRQGKRQISPALHFNRKPDDFFSTILIGNNFANILYTTFATVYLIQYLNETLTWLIITFVVVFFGEIFPKTLFRSLADKIILPISAIAYLFFRIFLPIIRLINFIIEMLLKVFNIEHRSVKDYFSRDELQLLLHAGVGHLEKQKYITNVLQFKDTKVREAMIPRTEVAAIEESASLDKARQVMIEKGTMYVIRYSGSLDDIIGVVFAYDLLQTDIPIDQITHKLKHIPENKSCAQLLKEFQQNNISLAVVVDEFGGTDGVITMDDLIDEVMGEPEPVGHVKALNQHTWLLDARIELDQLEGITGLSFEGIQAETIAGFILEKTGQIPRAGAVMQFEGFRLEVTKSSGKQINQIKLILDQ